MLDPIEKYKLEYSEVANLHRRYSVSRSGLTVFCLTASLVAFAIYTAVNPRPAFVAFAGIFMWLAALLSCVVFSYRREKANLYLREIWRWFDRGTPDNAPARFYDFAADLHEVVTEMLRDRLNWVLLAALLISGVAFIRLA